jgi:hypothetical protein
LNYWSSCIKDVRTHFHIATPDPMTAGPAP